MEETGTCGKAWIGDTKYESASSVDCAYHMCHTVNCKTKMVSGKNHSHMINPHDL